MDDAEVQRITQAVVDANYDRKVASGHLQMTSGELDKLITSNRALRKSCIPGAKSLTVGRGKNLAAKEQDLEVRRFRGKLKNSGLDDKQVKFAIERTELFTQHGGLLNASVNGSSVAFFFRALSVAEKKLDEIEADEYATDEVGTMWRSQDLNYVTTVLGAAFKQSATLQGAQLTVARLRKMQKELNGGGEMKSAKPGFTPKKPIETEAQVTPEPGDA